MEGAAPMDKWMNNNNFNKVLALALSIILWAMVHIDTASTPQSTSRLETKIIENVPIQVTGLDNDKYVLSRDADSVRMEVMGKSTDLTYVFSDAYKVTLDLSKAEPGTSEITLKYSVPRGVQLISITPRKCMCVSSSGIRNRSRLRLLPKECLRKAISWEHRW